MRARHRIYVLADNGTRWVEVTEPAENCARVGHKKCVRELTQLRGIIQIQIQILKLCTASLLGTRHHRKL